MIGMMSLLAETLLPGISFLAVFHLPVAALPVGVDALPVGVSRTELFYSSSSGMSFEALEETYETDRDSSSDEAKHENDIRDSSSDEAKHENDTQDASGDEATHENEKHEIVETQTAGSDKADIKNAGGYTGDIKDARSDNAAERASLSSTEETFFSQHETFFTTEGTHAETTASEMPSPTFIEDASSNSATNTEAAIVNTVTTSDRGTVAAEKFLETDVHEITSSNHSNDGASVLTWRRNPASMDKEFLSDTEGTNIEERDHEKVEAMPRTKTEPRADVEAVTRTDSRMEHTSSSSSSAATRSPPPAQKFHPSSDIVNHERQLNSNHETQPQTDHTNNEKDTVHTDNDSESHERQESKSDRMWYSIMRVVLPTAFVLVAAAFWSLVCCRVWYQEAYQYHHDTNDHNDVPESQSAMYFQFLEGGGGGHQMGGG